MVTGTRADVGAPWCLRPEPAERLPGVSEILIPGQREAKMAAWPLRAPRERVVPLAIHVVHESGIELRDRVLALSSRKSKGSRGSSLRV